MNTTENRVTLTCGHRVANVSCGVDVIIKDFGHDMYVWKEEQGPRTLRYGYVCPSCREDYQRAGVLFNTEQEAMVWVENRDDIVYRLKKRAEIRRTIPDRKSVMENKPDRISDLLEEAAQKITELRGY